MVFQGVGGAGDSFVGVSTCITRHSRYTFGLEDMVGSTFEVGLCLSLVLLLRLSGLKCPSPNQQLRIFFAADPFFGDVNII